MTTGGNMKALKVVMEHAKTTKGTQVYAAREDGVICRQIYLARDEMPEPPPAEVTLTVAWEVKS